MPKKQLNIRLSEDADHALRVLANKMGISLNAVVSLAIREYFNEWNAACERAKKYTT